MKKFKRKFSRDQATMMLSLIDEGNIIVRGTTAELMHAAILFDIANDIQVKLSDRFKKEISINWRPYQALAMQLYFSQIIDTNQEIDYCTNFMILLSIDIGKLYN